MSEEEKKAIVRAREHITDPAGNYLSNEYIETLLNLIDKQQKEIEIYEETENDYEHEIKRYEEQIEELKQGIEELKEINASLLWQRNNIDIPKLEDFNNHYISKDKIREVLEKERKKQKERDDISLALHSQYISLIDKIKKQLLEEG